MSAVDRSTPDPNRFLSTELANTATHGVGLGLSIAGLAILVVLATKFGTALHIVACSVYGATLVLLYLASTIYHSVHHIRAKRFFELLDHSAIYLLIAGTYTPFTLVTLRGAWGWWLFGIIWSLAVLGIVYKCLFLGRWKVLSVVIYLGMGWLCVVAIKPLMGAIIFFAWKSIPHHHAIWHLFVMAGSLCHFFSVMLFVLPRS
jgi:hemolysin III